MTCADAIGDFLSLIAYPIGAFGVACTQFADDFDSPAFRVIATIICIISVVFWLFLVVYTLPLIITGELLLGNARHKLEEEEEHVRAMY